MKTFRPSLYGPQHTLLREWLVTKRKAANLTQRQLADKLDVVHSLVGKVESGERRLDVVEFHLYCQAMDADPAEFFEIVNEAK